MENLNNEISLFACQFASKIDLIDKNNFRLMNAAFEQLFVKCNGKMSKRYVLDEIVIYFMKLRSDRTQLCCKKFACFLRNFHPSLAFNSRQVIDVAKKYVMKCISHATELTYENYEKIIQLLNLEHLCNNLIDTGEDNFMHVLFSNITINDNLDTIIGVTNFLLAKFGNTRFVWLSEMNNALSFILKFEKFLIPETQSTPIRFPEYSLILDILLRNGTIKQEIDEYFSNERNVRCFTRRALLHSIHPGSITTIKAADEALFAINNANRHTVSQIYARRLPLQMFEYFVDNHYFAIEKEKFFEELSVDEQVKMLFPLH